MNEALYAYDGELFPTYLRDGNALQFILPMAAHFCKGIGVDVGCGRWPFPGAVAVDVTTGGDAMALPGDAWDFIIASHSLEHLPDPVGALLHWQTKLRAGGVLFLYLPSTAMRYWNVTRNRRHLHEWEPAQMARILRDLGFADVIHGERDLAWSFAVVGWRP
jgi:SAM-dependent methyltransferase